MAETDDTRKRQVLTMLDADTYQQVQTIAEEEDRPISAAIRKLVTEALVARGARENQTPPVQGGAQ